MKNLLLIEDEIIIAEGIKLFLEKHDYISEIAINPANAIKLLQSSTFDIVICDINLEDELSGIDVIKKFHQQEKHGPVVFLTAYSNSQIIEAAESLLPYAYILKPFSNKQLLTTLNLAIVHLSRSKVNLVIRPRENDNLSLRERQVLEQLAHGKTNKEIGDCLFISKFTVDTHLRNIKEKLNLHKKGELIKYVLLSEG